MKFERELMLNVSSKEACSILNGDMTALLRKSIPSGFKWDWRGWINLYVTKVEPYLIKTTICDYESFEELDYNYQLANQIEVICKDGKTPTFEILNGKVVARFWFDGYAHLHELSKKMGFKEPFYFIYTGDGPFGRGVDYLLAKLCLSSKEEINAYGKGKEDLYVWYMKQLEIFDKPKELKDFYVFRKKWVHCGLACPPYVDEINYKMKRVYSAWQYVYRQV